MRPEPFRIEPSFVSRIWGARSLAPLYPGKSNLAEPIGEVWLTGVDCKVATGPFAGKTLGQAWREMPTEWRGTRFAEPGDFPLLVKFIFPTDKLSIQVHPDDAYAAVHEQAAGGRGKTEMWHAVHADPGAHVFVGTKPGVSKQQFVNAIANENLENLFVKHDVFNGDTFFIPAGTPHTIGPGMVLCEVQEYSDLTYRVYDYGRTDAKGKPRELHIEKALEVIQFSNAAGGKVLPLSLYTTYQSHSKSKVGAKVTLLSACRYFSVERREIYKSVEALKFPPTVGSIQRGRLQCDIRIFTSGQGQIHWEGGGSSNFQAGQCWFIPACVAVVRSTSQHVAMLRAYVPDLDVLRSALKVEGHSEAAIAMTIFE